MAIDNHKKNSFYKPGYELEKYLNAIYDDRFALQPVLLSSIPHDDLDPFYFTKFDKDDKEEDTGEQPPKNTLEQQVQP